MSDPDSFYKAADNLKSSWTTGSPPQLLNKAKEITLKDGNISFCFKGFEGQVGVCV